MPGLPQKRAPINRGKARAALQRQRRRRYIWTSERSGSLTRLANHASRFGMTKGWYGFSGGRGCACGGGLAEGADAVEEGADAGGVYGIFHDAVFFQAGADDDAVGEFEERGDVFDGGAAADEQRAMREGFCFADFLDIGRLAGEAAGNDEGIGAVEFRPLDVRGEVDAGKRDGMFFVHVGEDVDAFGVKLLALAEEFGGAAMIEFAGVPHARSGKDADADEARA